MPDFIDYAIVDHTLCPRGAETDWQEQVIRLPHANCPYDTRIAHWPQMASRETHGLPVQAFVFCCFNSNYKIEPVIFASWMQILQSVPASVLWLAVKNADIGCRLRMAASKADITPERLILAPIMPLEQHLQRYQMADLFLDTLWHNAHTTAADALWQGLPVLTCAGEAASSRLAASLLNALEMPELVTKDVQQYVSMAIYYATHPHALQSLREKLQAARYTAPLFDVQRTVHALEQAYTMAWQRYRQGKAPQGFDVPDLSTTPS